VIVIVILVIIGIVVGIVMATRPAPKAAALPATIPPPPAAVTPPAVTPPKAGTTPPPVGREVAGSSVAMTPDQMLAAKQAQADMRYAEPKLTSEQLAQAQRDAGKKVEVTKTAEGIAAVDKMKKTESPQAAVVAPPPPAAYNVKQNAIAYLADPARTSKMIGTAGGSLDVCKASCDGKPECTHFDRVGNSCTLYKGAEWVGSYPGGQSYCKSQCQT
jgi:hypothetical protein